MAWDRVAYYSRIQRFYSLRTVCKLFNSVFRQNGHFGSVLCLRDGLQSEDLCGMHEWIQQHGKFVNTLVATSGSPFLEAALTALHLCQCQLESPVLTAIYAGQGQELDDHPRLLSDIALILLSPFTSLMSCQLDEGPDGPGFSLHPLQDLPCLTKLTLTGGNFESLDAASYLTYLSIDNSNAKCDLDCACVT